MNSPTSPRAHAANGARCPHQTLVFTTPLAFGTGPSRRSPIVYAAATWHAYVLQAFFTPALSSPSAAEEREQRERLEDPLRGPSRRALSVRLLTLRPPPRGGRPDHAPSRVRRPL